MKNKLVKKNFDQNHFGAVLEDINSKFSVLVEGQQVTNHRLEKIEKRLAGVEKVEKELVKR